jgi:hypothetical protein
MPRSKTAAPTSRAPVISAGVAATVAVIYLIVIHAQDHRFSSRSIFIAAYLVVVAGTLLAGMRSKSPSMKAALLAGGANSLILVGFLGLFSIGLPLLVAGILSLPATARALSETPRPWGPAIVGLASLVAVAVIIAGILGTT